MSLPAPCTYASFRETPDRVQSHFTTTSDWWSNRASDPCASLTAHFTDTVKHCALFIHVLIALERNQTTFLEFVLRIYAECFVFYFFLYLQDCVLKTLVFVFCYIYLCYLIKAQLCNGLWYIYYVQLQTEHKYLNYKLPRYLK